MMKTKPLMTSDLGFTTLEYYKNCVISRIKDDVVFDIPEVNILISTLNAHFINQPFVYLSERINHYNVNPVIYLNLKGIDTLCGISIITFERLAFQTALYEKHFAKIPFEIFQSVEDGVKWANQIISKKKQTCKPDSVL